MIVISERDSKLWLRVQAREEKESRLQVAGVCAPGVRELRLDRVVADLKTSSVFQRSPRHGGRATEKE